MEVLEILVRRHSIPPLGKREHTRTQATIGAFIMYMHAQQRETGSDINLIPQTSRSTEGYR